MQTLTERKRYKELKEKCKSAWIDFATAILEIRERKLYLVEYSTFEAFCMEELSISREAAYKLMAGSKVIKNLNVYNCTHLPNSESQARPLSKLEPELQRETWAEIVEEKILVDASGAKITWLKVTAPLIAERAKPGQFVVVMVIEEGERVPLTVVEKDVKAGTITLIVQEVGLTTKLLGKLDKGKSIYAIVGPLGHHTEIKKYGKVILVGGGVGIAEIYPIAGALKQAGNHITTILGVRTKDLLILEEELKAVSDELFITTDDGSYGRKGFVTDILKELITGGGKPRPYGLIYAVGPIPMMKNVSLVTKNSGIKTLVSLNSLMIDATGMCGGCRVTVDGKTKFTCVDGPEFDASLIDWDELAQRNKIYEDKEKHICNLYRL